MQLPSYDQAAASAQADPLAAFRPLPEHTEPAIRSYLTGFSWPNGLQDSIIRHGGKSAFRFFIIDDSGSMSTNDGKRLIGSGAQAKIISCSRWAELSEAMRFHAGLANAANFPTEFRFLNMAAPLVLGDGSPQSKANYNIVMGLFDASPSGGTPLCRHIREVVEKVRVLAPQLRASGQKASLIIATDGQSSDGDIAAAMKPLEGMPVQVVIRLCTEEDSIVDYWNGIDSQLELEVDVLDDLCSEAEEISKVNGWLTYGEPLHRFRELGLPIKEFDLIDEAKLSAEQMRVVVSFILGGLPGNLPHPDLNWPDFSAHVAAANLRTLSVWDPLTRQPQRWIKMSQLTRDYHSGSGCCVIC